MGVGPVNAKIAEIRKHLGTLRQRYISIWQLVLLAGLMQALLHYGNLMLGEPMFGGLATWAYVNPFAALFVLLREFAPLVLVLVSSVVLKWQRTLRLMDGLFEQIAEEETAHRVSCELASAEWLADEKEKAAHREEALKLQLHHAHGHALAQQGELRKAQKEATQMAHHASQMMQQAEEWEQLARRHAAELAAVEEVRGASSNTHTPTRVPYYSQS